MWSAGKRELVFTALLFFIGGHAVFVGGETLEKIPVTQTPDTINPAGFLQKVEEAANLIKDESVALDLHFKVFPSGLEFRLAGDFYYKQPDKARLKLRGVPQFIMAQEAGAMKTAKLLLELRKRMAEDYQVKILGKVQYEGAACDLIQLLPQKNKEISSILLWINDENYTMPRLLFQYSNGSTLLQKREYFLLKNIPLVSSLENDYQSSLVSAVVTATFHNYKVNEGIPDEVFQGHSISSDKSPVSFF